MNHITIIKNAIGYHAMFCYGSDFGGQEIIDTRSNITGALNSAMKFADTERVFVKLEMAFDKAVWCHTYSQGWDWGRAERVSQHLVNKLRIK